MDMQWWHWAVLGLGLGLLELATPGGFFILFFGVGALLVAPVAARLRRPAVGPVGDLRRPLRRHPLLLPRSAAAPDARLGAHRPIDS